ncbi:MAG: hypothetical protein WD668_01100 [Saccharospirillum sp.]
MNETLHIGTRKGLFQFTRTGPGRWHQNDPAFLGDPVTMVLTDARTGNRYAGLNHGHFGVKLHAARAGTNDWQEIGTPAFPKVDEGDGPTVDLIWELVPGGRMNPALCGQGRFPAACSSRPIAARPGI